MRRPNKKWSRRRKLDPAKRRARDPSDLRVEGDFSSMDALIQNLKQQYERRFLEQVTTVTWEALEDALCPTCNKVSLERSRMLMMGPYGGTIRCREEGCGFRKTVAAFLLESMVTVKPMPEMPPPVPMQMPPTENPVVQREFEAKKLEVGVIDLPDNPTVHMAGPDLRNALVKWLTRGNMQSNALCPDCGFPRRSSTCRRGCE